MHAYQNPHLSRHRWPDGRREVKATIPDNGTDHDVDDYVWDK
jgi:hypothetical protein